MERNPFTFGKVFECLFTKKYVYKFSVYRLTSLPIRTVSHLPSSSFLFLALLTVLLAASWSHWREKRRRLSARPRRGRHSRTRNTPTRTTGWVGIEVMGCDVVMWWCGDMAIRLRGMWWWDWKDRDDMVMGLRGDVVIVVMRWDGDDGIWYCFCLFVRSLARSFL